MDAGRPGNREVVLDSASERTKLEHELGRAKEELAVINQKLEEKGDFGLGQGASTVYEWEMNLALRESAEAKIKSIQVCEVCGQPIDPDRLEILPHTTLCVQCAQANR
jgi:RNA polymerase-binding transcription factor DksA